MPTNRRFLLTTAVLSVGAMLATPAVADAPPEDVPVEVVVDATDTDTADTATEAAPLADLAMCEVTGANTKAPSYGPCDPLVLAP